MKEIFSRICHSIFCKKSNYILFNILIWIIIYTALPDYWTKNEIEKLYGYLFQFSGILSAIVITFIISKLFSQRQENLIRKEEIKRLSNKVSELRRIAYELLYLNKIWPERFEAHMRKKYPTLTYETSQNINLEEGSPEDILNRQYIDDKTYSKVITDLYLALESIKGDATESQMFLFHDVDSDFIYDSKRIDKWRFYNTANALYVAFDQQYSNINSSFMLENLGESEIYIRDRAKRINYEKYSDQSIPINKLLANLGSDFDSFYFSKLSNLLSQNRPILSGSLLYLINTMMVIMFSGALIPIFLQSFNVFGSVMFRLDFSVFITCIITFFFYLPHILTSELEV